MIPTTAELLQKVDSLIAEAKDMPTLEETIRKIIREELQAVADRVENLQCRRSGERKMIERPKPEEIERILDWLRAELFPKGDFTP